MTPQFERAQVAALLGLLAKPPRTILALFGPRQCGKTTAIRQVLRRVPLPGRYWTTDPQDSAPSAVNGREAEPSRPSRHPPDWSWVLHRWREARAEARRLARNGSGPFVLVFDEIQAVPQWSSIVKGLWDQDRMDGLPLHVVILCSAPMAVQSGLRESLAGRFDPVLFHHWSFGEMREAFGFDLDTWLYFGGYPGAAHLAQEGDEARWSSWVQWNSIEPTFERDVLAMTRVDKPVLMRGLFEVATRYSGRVLSMNKALGQLTDAGNTTTLSRYLHLLEAVGMVAGLPKYTGSFHWKRFPPKLNVLNTALMTAASGYSFAEARADRTFRGRLVETAVGAHLYQTMHPAARLHYWREGHQGVDLVLERGPHLLAIEVKGGPYRESPRGRDAFCQRFPGARSLLVGEGGAPLDRFLSAPAEHWLTGE